MRSEPRLAYADLKAMSPITASSHGKPGDLFSKVEALLNGLIAAVTGGEFSNENYQRLRREYFAISRVEEQLPAAFCEHAAILMPSGASSNPFNPRWEGRRKYLRDAFEPALSILTSEADYPTDDNIYKTIARLDSEHIAEAWRKALDGRNVNPEGAITAARTLVESVW